jgi:tetratricopeptide (TPR) repeat protein
MSWWSRLTGGKSESEARGRVDYLTEALALERQGDYDAALTSYRLALRDRPNDQRVLQNMAIAFSRTGQQEEAVRCYRRALEIDPSLSGAHYGLAFLLLKRGDVDGAAEHLERFLGHPPTSGDSQRWIAHARRTLAELRGEPLDGTDAPGGTAGGASAAYGLPGDATANPAGGAGAGA